MTTAPSVEEVVRILQRHLPSADYAAGLFGSRATGHARTGSNWDIGILGPRPLRGAVLQALRSDLDVLRTLHRFDVVDVTTTPDTFHDVAFQDAVKLV